MKIESQKESPPKPGYLSLKSNFGTKAPVSNEDYLRENLGIRQALDMVKMLENRPTFVHAIDVCDNNMEWRDRTSTKHGDVVGVLEHLFGTDASKIAAELTKVMLRAEDEDRLKLNPSEDWGEMVDYPFPSCLPEVLQNMADEISSMEGVPLAMAACAVMGAVSACLGRGLVIESKADKVAYGNVYIMVDAPSGTGKTGTSERALEPVKRFETELAREHHLQLPSLRSRMAILDRKNKGILQKDEIKEEDAISLAAIERELTDLKRQICGPSLLTGDTTTEKLVDIMMQNNGMTTSFTGEARGVIEVMSGRYSDGQSNESVYLSAFTVEEGVRQHRIKRGDAYIVLPWLSIMWMVQPDVAAKMWAKDSFVTGGLLPRFLCCKVSCPLQEDSTERKMFPANVKAAYEERLEDLLKHYRIRTDPPFRVKCSDMARKVITEFGNRTVQRINSGELAGTFRSFASRWAENAWKLCLLLHAGEHGSRAHEKEVSGECAKNAVSVACWFTVYQEELLGDRHQQNQNTREQKIMEYVNKNWRATASMIQKAGICDDTAEAKKILLQLEKAGVLESGVNEGRGPKTRYYFKPSNYTGKR